MKRYRVRIPPEVQTYVRHLPPLSKAMIRRALEEIERDPHIGKPLKGKLEGLLSCRVSHYRIVYQINQQAILVEVVEIAERRIVYERVATLLGHIS